MLSMFRSFFLSFFLCDVPRFFPSFLLSSFFFFLRFPTGVFLELCPIAGSVMFPSFIFRSLSFLFFSSSGSFSFPASFAWRTYKLKTASSPGVQNKAWFLFWLILFHLVPFHRLVRLSCFLFTYHVFSFYSLFSCAVIRTFASKLDFHVLETGTAWRGPVHSSLHFTLKRSCPFSCLSF